MYLKLGCLDRIVNICDFWLQQFCRRTVKRRFDGENQSDAHHNFNSTYIAGAFQKPGAEREDIYLALLKQEMYRLILLLTRISKTKTVSCQGRWVGKWALLDVQNVRASKSKINHPPSSAGNIRPRAPYSWMLQPAWLPKYLPNAVVRRRITKTTCTCRYKIMQCSYHLCLQRKITSQRTMYFKTVLNRKSIIFP